MYKRSPIYTLVGDVFRIDDKGESAFTKLVGVAEAKGPGIYTILEVSTSVKVKTW